MPRMEIFLLWATLGVYAVGVILIVLAALLFVAAERYDASHSKRPDDLVNLTH